MRDFLRLKWLYKPMPEIKILWKFGDSLPSAPALYAYLTNDQFGVRLSPVSASRKRSLVRSYRKSEILQNEPPRLQEMALPMPYKLRDTVEIFDVTLLPLKLETVLLLTAIIL